MNSTATINNVATISKKPSTKQEIVATNIKLLIEQLEAGQSEALTNYLTAMSRFHIVHLRERLGDCATNARPQPK